MEWAKSGVQTACASLQTDTGGLAKVQNYIFVMFNFISRFFMNPKRLGNTKLDVLMIKFLQVK